MKQQRKILSDLIHKLSLIYCDSGLRTPPAKALYQSKTIMSAPLMVHLVDIRNGDLFQKSERIEFIRLLGRMNGRVDDGFGWTALHHAVACQSPLSVQMAEALIEAGCKPDRLTSRTPFPTDLTALAAYHQDPLSPELLQTLIDAGFGVTQEALCSLSDGGRRVLPETVGIILKRIGKGPQDIQTDNRNLMELLNEYALWVRSMSAVSMENEASDNDVDWNR